MKAVHTAHWAVREWAIFGLHLGLLTPPIYLSVFEMIEINIGWKVLIWFGFVIIVGCSIRSYTLLRYLRWIGDRAYGKRTLEQTKRLTAFGIFSYS